MSHETRGHPLAAQQGQAATEFVVAAVFILVPLFLIIPLLGKYIDIRHAAIQRARYEVWEYTAWFAPGEKIMDGIVNHEDQYAVKKIEDTQQEGARYFFGDPYGKTEGINPLWTDHRAQTPRCLIADTASLKEAATLSDLKENPTPDGALGIINLVLEVINWITSTVAEASNWLGKFFHYHIDADFDAIYTKGYFTSTVTTQLLSLAEVLPDQTLAGTGTGKGDHLEIQAKASVLTQNWSAGSRDNAIAESRGLVFTALLSPLSDTLNTPLSWLQNLANTLHKFLPIKIKVPSVPMFGYVQDDLIPSEHLEGNKKELKGGDEKDKYGLYYYQEKTDP